MSDKKPIGSTIPPVTPVPFGTTACPKCTGDRIDRIWLRDGSHGSSAVGYCGYAGEHLCTHCGACGFRWPEHPADTPPTPAPFTQTELLHWEWLAHALFLAELPEEFLDLLRDRLRKRGHL